MYIWRKRQFILYFHSDGNIHRLANASVHFDDRNPTEWYAYPKKYFADRTRSALWQAIEHNLDIAISLVRGNSRFLLRYPCTAPTTNINIMVLTILSSNIGYSPDSKVYGVHMGPTWVLLAPGGPHVGLMNLAIWESVANITLTHLYCD